MESSKDTDRMERLRLQIIEEAKAEADRILKEARETVVSIKAEEKEKKVLVEDAQIKKISGTLDEELRDNEMLLEKERSRKVLQFKQDSLERVIDEAIKQFKEKMMTDQDYYYNTYLKDLIKSAVESTTFKESYLILNSRDKEYVQKYPNFLKNFKKKLTIKDNTFDDDDIGCIIQDVKSNIEFDNRLSKKVESRMEFMKTRISQVLFN